MTATGHTAWWINKTSCYYCFSHPWKPPTLSGWMQRVNSADNTITTLLIALYSRKICSTTCSLLARSVSFQLQRWLTTDCVVTSRLSIASSRTKPSNEPHRNQHCSSTCSVSNSVNERIHLWKSLKQVTFEALVSVCTSSRRGGN